MAAFAAGLTPVICLGEASNRLPAKATKELPPELLSLLRQKKMPKIFTYRRARFQGRGRARSPETGHHRSFPDPQDLSDLSVVGRSWAAARRAVAMP
jgi:hypothetical protein